MTRQESDKIQEALRRGIVKGFSNSKLDDHYTHGSKDAPLRKAIEAEYAERDRELHNAKEVVRTCIIGGLFALFIGL